MANTLEISPEKLERLCQLPRFERWISEANDCCLRFLSQAEVVHLKHGEWLCREGDKPHFFMIIEGEIRILKKEGDRETQFSIHRPGAFFGEIPLTMDQEFPIGGQSTGDSLVYKLDEETFWKLFSSCPIIAKDIAKVLAKRLQRVEKFSQTREKLVSLGTLAAGLAHELNNPAAAAQRAVCQLRESMADTERHAVRLRKSGMKAEKGAVLNYMLEKGRNGLKEPFYKDLTPMQRADLEDAITDWLDDHGVEDSCQMAPTLFRSRIDVAILNELVEVMSASELSPVICWIGSNLRSEELIGEIEQASNSISDLVQGVKSYSHLDEEVAKKVDVAAGIDATLLMLKHKLRGIEIDCNFDRSLPCIDARGNELNQVWTNLLDNAADVLKTGDNAHTGAQIAIRTGQEGACVWIEVEDNGPGIPQEIKHRVFEPFFTTKSVGSGTGLGLDIVHRIIVERHGGEISCDSTCSGTKFRVRLPIEK